MGGAERGCGPASVYHRESRMTLIQLVGIASIVEGILDDSVLVLVLVLVLVMLRPVLEGRLVRQNLGVTFQFPTLPTPFCSARPQIRTNSLFIVP